MKNIMYCIYNGRHHGHGRAYINISRMSKRGALNSSPPHLKRFIVKVLYIQTHTHALAFSSIAEIGCSQPTPGPRAVEEYTAVNVSERARSVTV